MATARGDTEGPWARVLPPEMRAHVGSFLCPHDRFVLSLTSKREHALHRLFTERHVPGDLACKGDLYFELAAHASDGDGGGSAQLAWLWTHTFVRPSSPAVLFELILDCAAAGNTTFLECVALHMKQPHMVNHINVARQLMLGNDEPRHDKSIDSLLSSYAAMGGELSDALSCAALSLGSVPSLEALQRVGAKISCVTLVHAIEEGILIGPTALLDVVVRALEREVAAHGAANTFEMYQGLLLFAASQNFPYDCFEKLANTIGYASTSAAKVAVVRYELVLPPESAPYVPLPPNYQPDIVTVTFCPNGAKYLAYYARWTEGH